LKKSKKEVEKEKEDEKSDSDVKKPSKVKDMEGIPIVISADEMELYEEFLKWKKDQGLPITAVKALKVKSMH